MQQARAAEACGGNAAACGGCGAACGGGGLACCCVLQRLHCSVLRRGDGGRQSTGTAIRSRGLDPVPMPRESTDSRL